MTDKTYSHSAVDTYLTCPLAYYRSRVLKEQGEDNWFAAQGTLVHSITEDYYKYVFSGGQPLDLEVIRRTMTKKYHAGMVEVNKLPKPPVMTKASIAKREWNILDYFNNFVPNPEVVQVERHMEWELSSGHKFQGYIDEVHQTQKGTKVTDIKSKYEKKYHKQLFTYCLGIKALDGEYPSQVSVRGYTTGVTVNIDVDSDILKEVVSTEAEIIRTIGDIEKEKQWKAKGEKFFCNNLCNFRNDCSFKIK